MKRPPPEMKEIVGEEKHRRRNYLICCDYIKGLNAREIKDLRKLNITIRRVQSILYENNNFVNPRIAWPKSKRIHMLQRDALDAPSSKKDRADLLEQLRKEVEGDAPLIDQSQHVHFVYAWKNSNSQQPDHNRDTVRAAVVSE